MLKYIFNILFAGYPPGSGGRVHIQEASIPDGERVYIIGDIHGRNDLLNELLAVISKDSQNSPNIKKSLIYLGDYIDRGPNSKGVIDTILSTQLPNVTPITLMGNHEQSMLGFLNDPEANSDWLKFGGAETILSYGVSIHPGTITAKILKETSESLNRVLPDAHRQFLLNLKESYILGDYMFVHAGIDPKRSIKKQRVQDLLWIRADFIEHSELYEKVIVHGHTIVSKTELYNNRIAIDTGAYYSGILTCLSIEGQERRIVQTIP